MHSGDETLLSLKDISAILIRRKWQVIITFLLVVVAATAGTLLMPKQYDSHMKILVKNGRAEMVVTTNSNTGSGNTAEVSEAQINTEIELLNSRNLLEEVVTKTGLDHATPAPANGSQPLAVEKAVASLLHTLKISPVRKADIIEVGYSNSDPKRAAAVLRQLAESYLEAHLKVHGTPGSYQFFASQTARYRNDLKDAEEKLSKFRQTDNIVMLAQQKEVMLQKAMESEAAVLQADAAIGEYTQKIADTRRQLLAATPRVLTQSRTVSNQFSVEHLSTMVAELQNRRTQLLAKFRPDDRLVAEVDKEITDTNAALEKAVSLTASEQSTDINPIHQTLEMESAKEQGELSGIEAKRQTLAQQAKAYRQQLMALAGATTDYDDLVRQQKEAEGNYLLYSRKMEEARIAESLDQQKIANVAIAETPTESHVPAKPNVPLNLELGIALAGFLSLGVAFAAEYYLNPQPGLRLSGQLPQNVTTGARHLLGTVEDRSALEQLTGLPVLAILSRP